MIAIDRIQTARARPTTAMVSKPLVALHLVLCACAFFGYPLVASISSFVQEQDNLLSISFRAFVLLASILAIGMHLGTSRAAGVSRTTLLVLWLVIGGLLFRLLHDVFGLGLEPLVGTDAATFTIWYLGVCVVPALALFGGASIDRLSAAAMPAFIIACVVAATTTASSFLGEESLDLTSRAGSLKLNPISYAYVGALLFLLGLTRTRWRIGLGLVARALAMLAGLTIVIISGSRGPLLAMLVATFAFTWVRSRNRPLLLFLALLGATAVILSTQLIDYLELFPETALVNRITDLSYDVSAAEREFVWSGSWDIFLANPLFGGAIVDPGALIYPHNFLIEAAMTGGVFLLILVFVLMVSGVRASILLLRQADMLAFIGVVAIFMILMGMFSGSLYGSGDFWAALVLVHVYAALVRRERPGDDGEDVHGRVVGQL